jgi:hypothetical protein
MSARRRLFSAEVSEASDSGQVAQLAGERLAGCRFSTALNLGFDTCEFQLLTSDFGEWWGLDQAQALEARWFHAPAVFRLYAQGESVFEGRLWELRKRRPSRDERRQSGLQGKLCRLFVQARGLAWTEYSNELSPIQDVLAGTGGTIALSELVKALTDALPQGSPIARVYNRVQDTGINVGPLTPSVQDTGLDLIAGGVRTGDASSLEVTFMVYEGKSGPIVQPLDTGNVQPRWALSTEDGGLEEVYSNEEFASGIKTVYTDSDGRSATTETVESQSAVARHGGIRRTKALSLHRANSVAARNAAETLLALKSDPRALEGSLRLSPPEGDTSRAALATNYEGAREPSWRIRAGQAVRLTDAWLHDPRAFELLYGHAVIVARTSHDIDSGATDVQLDQRATRKRPGEEQAEIARLRRQLEPGSKFTLIKSAEATSDQGFDGDTLMANPRPTFHLPHRSDISVTITAMAEHLDTNTATGIHVWAVGFALDDEEFITSNDTRSRFGIIDSHSVLGSAQQSLTAQFTVEGVGAGEHTLYLWAHEGASVTSAQMDALSVQISAEVSQVSV